ncbi:MAG: Rossmann-like and DUF2520 domain-containing protein [Candidatus Saccharicenans sp.]
MKKTIKSFSIIGAGRVGLNLAAALVQKGFILKKVSDRFYSRARKAVKIIGQGQATKSNLLAAASAEIILISVPDCQLTEVAEEISILDYPGKFVFHTSGAFSSSVLKPLSKKGARVASLHPIQTFALTEPDPRIFKGIFFGLEGDQEAIQLGAIMAKKLSGQVLLISAENKPAYHLACSIASNFLIILLNEVKNLFSPLGINEELTLEIITPLINETLHNVKKLGFEASLTGPIIRGDLETVKRHLAVTHDQAALDRIYRAMALEALSLAKRRGLPEDKIKALRQLLAHK